MAGKKEFHGDATSKRMNLLAEDLLEIRSKACDEIAEFGWPIDVYNDVEWYKAVGSLGAKKEKMRPQAEMIRNSILEIDFTLAAMNHYSETYTDTSPSEEVDTLIEALDSAINAIRSFFTPNAMVGERQRLHARRGRRNSVQLKTYQGWAVEDEQLRKKNPKLSKSDRAKQIARNQNMNSKSDERIVSWETVRSAIRRISK